MGVRTVPTLVFLILSVLFSHERLSNWATAVPLRREQIGSPPTLKHARGNDIHLFTFSTNVATYTRNIRAVVRVLHFYTAIIQDELT